MTPPLLVTVAAILWWALLSVVSRILLLRYGFDPWLFSFLQLCAGGAALLIAGAGRGGGLSSFRRPATWALGALRVLSAALYTSVLAWISVLEAGVLGGMNLPVAAVAVWLLAGRRPARLEWIGHCLILAAAAALAIGLEDDLRVTVLGLMVLNAACLVGMTLLAEHHPENLSDAPGGRAWFTGVVLLVTAALFVAVRLLQGGSAGGTLTPSLFVAGGTVGVALRAPAMLLAFWSIRLAGAQGYTAAVVFLPLFGMVFEQAGVAVGLLDQSRFQAGTLALAVLGLVGALGVVAARRRMGRSSRSAAS
jgi:drug/metabolite transporter (DMT)-like permease